MNRFKRFFAALLCLMLLCGCSSDSGSLLNPNSNPDLASTAATDAAESTTAPMSLPSADDASEFPVSWESAYYDDGSLRYTITDAHIVTSEDVLNRSYLIDNGYDLCVQIYHAEYREQYEQDRREYADKYITKLEPTEIIDENGKLNESISAVLIEVTIENIDATNRYLENGELVNRYDNPYAFSITHIGRLTDRKRPVEGTSEYSAYEANYFSLTGSCSGLLDCYHLEPGESVSVQIGFIISTDADGNKRDLSQCFLSFGSEDTLVAELHLGESE